jgi:hypothetical protein
MAYKVNGKRTVWMAGSILVLLILLFAYLKAPNQQPFSNNMSILIIGLVLGAVIMFLLSRVTNTQKQNVVKEDSHTVIESIRKVFKIVFAEGHFNELYNYEQTKKLFGFIPSTKRALVIIEARVLVGFDFSKCTWETDEVNRKIKLISFPEPEIISIEPTYKYYNFDEGIFNLLNRNDLTHIQANAKKQVELAAIKSHLPKIAADQMRTLLTEVVQSRNWQLENTYKINEEQALLPKQEI